MIYLHFLNLYYMIYHSFPQLHNMTHKLNPKIVRAILSISLVNWNQGAPSILWYSRSPPNLVEKTVNQSIPTSPKHRYTSTRIPLGPTVFLGFDFFMQSPPLFCESSHVLPLNFFIVNRDVCCELLDLHHIIN